MALRFTLRQLEYFVAVGEEGSIALASQRVGVSSPSISAAIAHLEAELGLALFIRQHAQGLTLTPSGQRIFNEARKILGDAQALHRLAKDISERPHGPISIGSLSTIAPLISATLKRSFETEFPATQVSLREGDQPALLRMLNRAEIDLAITYDMDIPVDVAFSGVVALQPRVILAADHPLATQEEIAIETLCEHEMVLLDLPLSRDYFLSLFHEQGLRPRVGDRSAQLSVVLSLIANGYGYGILNIRPVEMRAPDGEPLVSRPLQGTHRPVTLGLASKLGENRPRLHAAFEEHFRARARQGKLPGLV